MRVSLISLLLGSTAAQYSNPYQRGTDRWNEWNRNNGLSDPDVYNTPSYTFAQPYYNYPTYGSTYSYPTQSSSQTVNPSQTYSDGSSNHKYLYPYVPPNTPLQPQTYSSPSYSDSQPSQSNQPSYIPPPISQAYPDLNLDSQQSSQSYQSQNPYSYGTTQWDGWNTRNGVSSNSAYTPSYSQSTYDTYSTAGLGYSNTNTPSYSQPSSGYNSYYNNNTPYVEPSYSYSSYTPSSDYYQPTITPSYSYSAYTPDFSQYSSNNYLQPQSYASNSNSYSQTTNPYPNGSHEWHDWNRRNSASYIYMKAQNGPDMENEEGEDMGVEVQEDKVVVKDEGVIPEDSTNESSELPVVIIVISVLIVLALSAITIRYIYKTMKLKSNKPEVQVESQRQSVASNVELVDENGLQTPKFESHRQSVASDIELVKEQGFSTSKFDIALNESVIQNQNNNYEK